MSRILINENEVKIAMDFLCSLVMKKATRYTTFTPVQYINSGDFYSVLDSVDLIDVTLSSFKGLEIKVKNESVLPDIERFVKMINTFLKHNYIKYVNDSFDYHIHHCGGSAFYWLNDDGIMKSCKSCGQNSLEFSYVEYKHPYPLIC